MEIIKEYIVDVLKVFFLAIYTYNFSLITIKDERKEEKQWVKLIKCSFVMIVSILIIIIKSNYNYIFAIMTLIICISIILSLQTKSKIQNVFLIVILSLSINYILFILAIMIEYIFINIINSNYKNNYIDIMIIEIIYYIIIKNVMKIKRIKRGMSFFKTDLFNDYFVTLILNISVIIIFSIFLFRGTDRTENNIFGIGLTVVAVILFLTIKKSFELYYKQKLLIKDLDETKEELAKTKEELAKAEKENLEASKRSHSLVHRQKALEFQISELTKNKNSKDINKIKQDVENLSKELYGKEVMTQLSKTNIELIDNMFRYMQFECYKNEIRFDLQICGNIYKMINNVINKETLEILLADHIKNAIIAVKHSENSNKSILVKLGKIGDCYGVCIYDSGIEFKEETLKTLGKKPSSTHLDEGGSGMGFLNTFDTLNKYKASLIIDEIGMPCEENYTKVIMIKFDGKNEFKVNSYRQQKAV